MTDLQPQLEETRCQELTYLAFLIVQVSASKEGRKLSRKKAPLKTQGFGPYLNKPFRVPITRKEAPTGNSSQSSNQSFFSVRGNQISEAPGVIFDPTLGDEGMETPPPMTP